MLVVLGLGCSWWVAISLPGFGFPAGLKLWFPMWKRFPSVQGIMLGLTSGLLPWALLVYLWVGSGCRLTTSWTAETPWFLMSIDVQSGSLWLFVVPSLSWCAVLQLECFCVYDLFCPIVDCSKSVQFELWWDSRFFAKCLQSYSSAEEYNNHPAHSISLANWRSVFHMPCLVDFNHQPMVSITMDSSTSMPSNTWMWYTPPMVCKNSLWTNFFKSGSAIGMSIGFSIIKSSSFLIFSA